MTIRPRLSILNPSLHRPSALVSVPRDPNCLWLDKNENLDPKLAEILQEVLSGLPSLALSTYPEAGELYRKLGYLLDVDPLQILLTPGSDGAIRLTFETFVDTGDVVVHTTPTFAMYPVYSQMFGADVHTLKYERAEKKPYLDLNNIFITLRERKPKLLCLPNPDSPTGTVLAPEVLRNILSACEESGTVLLVDEAYHPFYDWTAIPWTKFSPNLVVARTFAKAWGAAGLRIGYAVAHPKTIGLMHKMRPMYEVSTLAVGFMTKMLDKVEEMTQSVARLLDGKRYFMTEMRSLGFDVLETEGNFLHVAFGDQGSAIHAALSSKVYYRMNFDCQSLSGYSRFTVATQPGMEKVTNIIKETVLGRKNER